MSGESGYEDRIKPEKWVSLQNIDQEQNNRIKEEYSNPNWEGQTGDEPNRKKMKMNKQCNEVRDHSPGEVNVNNC